MIPIPCFLVLTHIDPISTTHLSAFDGSAIHAMFHDDTRHFILGLLAFVFTGITLARADQAALRLFPPDWGVHTAMVAYLLGYEGRDEKEPNMIMGERISMRHTHTHTHTRIVLSDDEECIFL